MGSPISLLGNARAFARDYARDQMPAGSLWDTMDFVPAIIDAPLTGRGGWKWGSGSNLVTVDGPFLSGVLMPFREGDQLLVADRANVYQVDQVNPLFPLTIRGATTTSVQNPIKLGNVAVHFDAAGNQPPQLWQAVGAPVYANAAHKHPKVGAAYKAMLVSGGAPGETHVVRFSKPNTVLTDAASYDANSFIPTSLPVTAIAALRGMLLVFHANSVERIRGSTPPHGTVALGDDDMFVEDAFDHSGTIHPKTLAYWQDNVIYANELGVHITDGSTVRSLTGQGGIASYWRVLYDGAATVVGTTFLDYYIVTLRHPPDRPPQPYMMGEDGVLLPPPLETLEVLDVARPPIPPLPPDLPPIRPPVPELPVDAYNTTLICDLNRRQWYRFSNINSVSYIAGGGTSGMERVWASIADSTRLARIGPTFYPDFGSVQVDDNGIAVRPRLETPWYRLGEEGRKRVRFVYLSYDVEGEGANANPVRVGYVTTPQGSAQSTTPSWFTSYTNAGTLPSTTKYSRFRLPVYKFPYGIAFFVETTGPVFHAKIYDIAVEASVAERSRV